MGINKMKIGQSFGDELSSAGLLNVVACWGDDGSISYVSGATSEQIAAVEAALAKHDPASESLSLMETGVQTWLDAQARKYGFDNIASAISYFNSSNAAWKAQALAFSAWRDAVWGGCYTGKQAVLSGTATMPKNTAELIATLLQPSGVIA